MSIIWGVEATTDMTQQWLLVVPLGVEGLKKDYSKWSIHKELSWHGKLYHTA